MKLNKEQKESILRRISFVETELKDAESFAKLNFETYKKNRTARRNIERILENIANTAIDIAKIWLAGLEGELPATYREALLKLSELGVVEEKVVLSLADLARARNVLAHQYLDMGWGMVEGFLREGRGQAKKFFDQVNQEVITQL